MQYTQIGPKSNLPFEKRRTVSAPSGIPQFYQGKRFLIKLLYPLAGKFKHPFSKFAKIFQKPIRGRSSGCSGAAFRPRSENKCFAMAYTKALLLAYPFRSPLEEQERGHLNRVAAKCETDR
jgi:hypothetical protein